MSATKFYGIYIQKESDHNEKENINDVHVYTSYEDAKKVIKEYKNARFKCFASEEEATYFASNGSTSGPGNPSVMAESTPFRSLKRPDIYPFRQLIESDDVKSVKILIWENPRYLIGIGDTPTIMQEGARYNALHVAAMYNSYKCAECVLEVISDKLFTQLLYGANGDQSYLVRPEVLLDMYLNTPDKALNETPLHFAVKHGSLEVVQIFIKYPQLMLNVKNKYDQTPKDMVCKFFRAKLPKKPSGSAVASWYANEIHKLLDEQFYVPVWRSEEDVIQPIIGKPFSPKSPPVYPLATSPLSPTMEIKAVAGPMSFDEASIFHKTWKSPIKSTNSSTPHVSKGILLRSPLCCDKVIEKVGRTLAKRYHVSWKEYWPFLDDYVDLASEEGLELLEKHLHNIIVTTTFEAEKNSFIMNTPMSDLCNAFSRFSIVSPDFWPSSTIHESGDSPPVTSRYLCMDNLCSSFAKNLISEFEQNFHQNTLAEDNLPLLIKRIRNFSGTINSCVMVDTAFCSFPFEKIHARAAFWIRSSLKPSKIQILKYVGSIFQLVHDTESSDLIHCITMSPSSSVELNTIIRTLKCINTFVIKLLKTEEIDEVGPHCSKEWFSMERCSCFNQQSNTRTVRGRSDVRRRRKLFLTQDESPRKEKIDPSPSRSETEVTGETIDCDKETKFRILDHEICDSDDEGEFNTAPNSLNNSDEEMESPDEGPELFIYDNRGTSMDNAVLEAISDVEIDPNKYPSIYRWKHSILLHNNLKRFSWPSPNVKRPIDKKLHT